MVTESFDVLAISVFDIPKNILCNDITVNHQIKDTGSDKKSLIML